MYEVDTAVPSSIRVQAWKTSPDSEQISLWIGNWSGGREASLTREDVLWLMDSLGLGKAEELAEAQRKLEKLGEVARKLRKDAAVYNANEHVHLSVVASGAATMIEEALSSLSLEALSELGVGAGVVGVAKEDSGWAVAGERVELRRFSSGFWSSEKFTHPFTDAQVDKHFDVVEVL